ncbi:MAG: hypothetical protein AB1498_12360 [bacterium]
MLKSSIINLRPGAENDLEPSGDLAEHKVKIDILVVVYDKEEIKELKEILSKPFDSANINQLFEKAILSDHIGEQRVIRTFTIVEYLLKNSKDEGLINTIHTNLEKTFAKIIDKIVDGHCIITQGS